MQRYALYYNLHILPWPISREGKKERNSDIRKKASVMSPVSERRGGVEEGG